MIELARQAISSRVFVAEARRDLEVTVEARHHQQLLVLLRRLRQRVELAGMNARRHQEVAGAFRRRRREDRRLEFEESGLLHPRTHRVDDGAAGHDVLVQLLAAKIEEAVLEPDFLGVFLIAEHRHRQFACLAQHFDLVDEDFDGAGRQFRIVSALGAAAHLAVDLHHPLGTQLLGETESLGIRIDHALRHSVVVAQIDEQQSTMVADTVTPAGQPDLLANVGIAEGAAGVGTITVHGNPGKRRQRAESRDIGANARAQGLPERRERGNRMVPDKLPYGGKKLNKNNARAAGRADRPLTVTGLALVLLDHDGRDAKGPGPHRENLRPRLAAFPQFGHLQTRLFKPGSGRRNIGDTP